MFEVKVNEKAGFEVAIDGNTVSLDGQHVDVDLKQVGDQAFQVLYKGGSYTVHVLEVDAAEKTVLLKVNGKKATVALSTELDRLLKSMGLENAASSKVSEVKAPMPGLIHSVLVAVGDTVAKGDALLILEAMKMENIIKSPADGTISKIAVKVGENVEKGQILIGFG